MAIKTAKAAHSTADSPGPASAAGGGIAALLPSWRRSLVARRISPRTIATYTTSVERLAGYLAEHGMPSPATETRRTVRPHPRPDCLVPQRPRDDGRPVHRGFRARFENNVWADAGAVGETLTARQLAIRADRARRAHRQTLAAKSAAARKEPTHVGDAGDGLGGAS